MDPPSGTGAGVHRAANFRAVLAVRKIFKIPGDIAAGVCRCRIPGAYRLACCSVCDPPATGKIVSWRLFDGGSGGIGHHHQSLSFFWQASQEAEEVQVRREDKPLRQDPSQAPKHLRKIKIDTYAGMAVSNAAAFFIMLTAAATLHAHGNTNIQTAAQAASALEQLAGRFAYALFATGIIVTGLLAVPVLAGAAAYAVGEAMQWRVELEIKPARATKFYLTLGVATLVGLLLNFVHFDPIKSLFIAAVINGVLAAPVMALMMVMTRSSKIMGKFKLPIYLEVMVWTGAFAMFVASIAFLVSSIK